MVPNFVPPISIPFLQINIRLSLFIQDDHEHLIKIDIEIYLIQIAQLLLLYFTQWSLAFVSRFQENGM